jgi:hypothetical protein
MAKYILRDPKREKEGAAKRLEYRNRSRRS